MKNWVLEGGLAGNFRRDAPWIFGRTRPPGPPLHRRGPARTSTCTKNQPRIPIQMPRCDEQKKPPDCFQVPPSTSLPPSPNETCLGSSSTTSSTPCTARCGFLPGLSCFTISSRAERARPVLGSQASLLSLSLSLFFSLSLSLYIWLGERGKNYNFYFKRSADSWPNLAPEPL